MVPASFSSRSLAETEAIFHICCIKTKAKQCFVFVWREQQLCVWVTTKVVKIAHIRRWNTRKRRKADEWSSHLGVTLWKLNNCTEIMSMRFQINLPISVWISDASSCIWYISLRLFVLILKRLLFYYSGLSFLSMNEAHFWTAHCSYNLNQRIKWTVAIHFPLFFFVAEFETIFISSVKIWRGMFFNLWNTKCVSLFPKDQIRID